MKDSNFNYNYAKKIDRKIYELAAYDLFGGFMPNFNGPEESEKIIGQLHAKFNYFKNLIRYEEWTIVELEKEIVAKNGPFPQNPRREISEENIDRILEDMAQDPLPDPLAGGSKKLESAWHGLWDTLMGSSMGSSFTGGDLGTYFVGSVPISENIIVPSSEAMCRVVIPEEGREEFLDVDSFNGDFSLPEIYLYINKHEE